MSDLKIPDDLRAMYDYCNNYHRVPGGTKAEWWNTKELIERIAKLETLVREYRGISFRCYIDNYENGSTDYRCSICRRADELLKEMK